MDETEPPVLLDFVIPLKQNNVIIRTVVEGIISFYSPRNIYIITDLRSTLEILEHSLFWKTGKTIIHTIDETIFRKAELERNYTWIDEKSREYGWWFQQIIKLDAVNRIPCLSDPFIIWDADLIPLLKWDLYNVESREYRFAILQETAKNEFNRNQYHDSILSILGLETVEPIPKGTFVPHHFIFHHDVIQTLIYQIGPYNWQEKIMGLSATYYRFSEYMCVATYMQIHFPKLLKYHSYEEFGEKGIRFRESLEIQEKIRENCAIKKWGLGYEVFREFVKKEFVYNREISYIQIEHVTNHLL
jgi:hypothetical protein